MQAETVYDPILHRNGVLQNLWSVGRIMLSRKLCCILLDTQGLTSLFFYAPLMKRFCSIHVLPADLSPWYCRKEVVCTMKAILKCPCAKLTGKLEQAAGHGATWKLHRNTNKVSIHVSLYRWWGKPTAHLLPSSSWDRWQNRVIHLEDSPEGLHSKKQKFDSSSAECFQLYVTFHSGEEIKPNLK